MEGQDNKRAYPLNVITLRGESVGQILSDVMDKKESLSQVVVMTMEPNGQCEVYATEATIHDLSTMSKLFDFIINNRIAEAAGE